jgi:glucose-6-phosphate 1-dehydrogenase
MADLPQTQGIPRTTANARPADKPDSFVVVIFGASGDLASRKLIPALYDLHRARMLPERFAVLGVSRTAFSLEAFRAKMTDSVRQFDEQQPVEEKLLAAFAEKLHYLSIDTANPADYAQVRLTLETIDREHGTAGNYIFYLSTPPAMYAVIAHGLGTQGLQDQAGGWRRLIVEKPFGYDLPSAIDLNAKLERIFRESQIYRIDHYLGKETVQNILVFRFANSIFEPLWNSKYVQYVEVTAAEHIGVENRGRFYEGAGAVRDIIQNHLLQCVGVVAMEPPSVFNSIAVRNETLKVFQSLRPIKPTETNVFTVRGQYTASTIKGQPVNGYRQEKDVAPDSKTETYAAIQFYIDNWRWGGVPFFMRAGKRLPTRVTEVAIHFKPTPHPLFGQNEADGQDGNKLIIRIQPDEGVLLKLGMKLPGAGFRVTEVRMDVHYKEFTEGQHLPAAYERLLLDCALGDSTLFTRSDAVEACWEFITPILTGWQTNRKSRIFGYPAGTWGPQEAEALMACHGWQWRQPCKNLASDGLYCEL